MAQAIRLLIDGHQFDDLAREIPHLIDKVNDRPDDKQAADNLREVAVGALDRYRRFADQYQYWVESETDVGRRRGLYKVVLDFWRLVRDASDALKNARHRTSFLHVPPPVTSPMDIGGCRKNCLSRINGCSRRGVDGGRIDHTLQQRANCDYRK